MLGLLNLGGGEIILILVLVLVLFGAKKLPELAKGLGTGIREFKKATNGITSEITASMNGAVHSPLRSVAISHRPRLTSPVPQGVPPPSTAPAIPSAEAANQG